MALLWHLKYNKSLSLSLSCETGWMIGCPLDLNFGLLETASICFSVLLVAFVIIHGESHWLYGAILTIAYVVVAAAFWVHKSDVI